jgi:hypothetical protein
MKILGVLAEQAVNKGHLIQVVLADGEGLVLENLGTRFSEEDLIACFIGTSSRHERIRQLLNVGPISEFAIRLERESLILSGRFFRADDENYLLIMVIPSGAKYGRLCSRIIKSVIEALEGNQAVTSFTGTITGLDLLDYMQTMMLSGKSTIMGITSGEGEVCKVFLRDGRIVHAVCGDVEGEQALYQSVKFQGGRLSNSPWTEPDKVTIDKPGDYLLMQCARMKDEDRR